MKLTGILKKQVESESSKDGKREAIKKAGMLLTDDELDMVSGGNEQYMEEYINDEGRGANEEYNDGTVYCYGCENRVHAYYVLGEDPMYCPCCKAPVKLTP